MKKFDDKDICRHNMYLKESNVWLCDEGGLPVKRECRMACYTPKKSKVDNALELRAFLENAYEESDDEFDE